MPPEYYDRLGVSADATTEEITEAYRERLKEVHPDVSDASDAGEHTKQLIEAKEVLTDETERARYDRLGHDRYVGGETGEGYAPDGRADAGESGRGSVDTDTPGDGHRAGDDTDRGEGGTDTAGPGRGTGRTRTAGPGRGTGRTRTAGPRGDTARAQTGSIDWEAAAGEDWEEVSEAVWQEVTGGTTAGDDSVAGDAAGGPGGIGPVGPDMGPDDGGGHRTPDGEASGTPGGVAGTGPNAGTDGQAGVDGGGGDRTVGWYRGGDPSGTTREAWSVGGTTAESRRWRLADGHRRGTSFPPHRVLSPAQTTGLFLVAFLCYPLLLGGVLFAPLAPSLRVLAALGLVFVVAVLVVLPQLGVPVFGSWTLLFPLVLTELGLSVVAPTTLFATGGALCSLVFAVVSRLLTRPPLV